LGDEVLDVNLLGTFSVVVDGELVPDDAWRLRKAKTLIKLLALAPERRLHADQAAAALWPDRDQAATRNNLHQAIYAARRALDCGDGRGLGLLELSDDLITLGPHDPVRIDADVFERAAARARAEGDPAAYRSALAVYEGELLPEDRYEEWTVGRRDALRELRLALGIELAELEATSEPAAAIGRLREVLVEAPLHEPAHRALMRQLAGAGRRQEALAQFQELKRGLRREFEDEADDETRALYREILTRSFGPETELPQPTVAAEAEAETPGRLPRQLTSFIGRERELVEATALLRGARLLTLTGAGGCGKTRLALELARQRGEEAAAEVWVVELAAVTEPELTGSAVAGALGTRIASGRAPELALGEHIGEREMLLVLDNCEHLIEAVAHLVESLLARCPRLVVLATSREPLRVPGELTWRVPSLSLPRLGDDPSAEESLRAESVRLFADRAARAAPGFEVDTHNTAAVAALCHRLDGMPLAIELAAARVSVLTPAQIVDRLDDSLDLLAGGSRTAMTRQQTLRATLAWSFDLLDDDEQVLLRRLAVFAGSFGIEAVEAVCAEQPGGRSEVLAVFGCLIDKSLVQVEEGGGSGSAPRRYFQLDTVRQFEAEQLDAAGERATFERRHREWYVELAGDDPTPAGELPARAWLAQLDLERDNLRAALASAQAADPETGLRLAVSLWRYWMMRGYLAEAYRWLAELLAAAPEPTALRARALLAVSLIGVRRGVYERIEEYVAESVATFAELGDQGGTMDAVEAWGGYRVIVGGEVEIEALVGEHEGLRVDDLPAARPAAWAAQVRGISAWLRRDLSLARRDLETAVERLGELRGERRPALWPLSYGFISAEEEFGYPFLLHEETVLVARRVGAEAAIAYTLVNLAAVTRAEGELTQAGELVEESLAVFRHLDDRHGEAYALNALGNLARAKGDSELGQELLGRSLGLRVETGDRRGNGITLVCLALAQARAGDTAGARAAAERGRRWFVANDDLVGISAAEVSLAAVALSELDHAAARAHLEAAVAVHANLGSSHQEAWALAVLAALCAEEEERPAGRRWLRQAQERFERLGARAGSAYCLALERNKDLQSHD
jgi:predicted ATPase/DNA-binding SARP family transcriptional activator